MKQTIKLAQKDGMPAITATGETFDVEIGGETVKFFVNDDRSGYFILSHYASGLGIFIADGQNFLSLEECLSEKLQRAPTSIEIGFHMVKNLVKQYGAPRLRSMLACQKVINPG
jgi:hypothetical protein